VTLPKQEWTVLLTSRAALALGGSIESEDERTTAAACSGFVVYEEDASSLVKLI